MVEKTGLMKEFEDETGKNAVWGGKVTKQFKEWKRLKKELDEKKEKIEEKEEKVEKLKNEVVRKEKRVYSGHELVLRAAVFALLVYSFLLGISFLKAGVVQLSDQALGFLPPSALNAENAFLTGWVVSYLSQSGSVIAFISIVLADAGAINPPLLFWALLGTIIGNTSTSLIAVMFTKPDRADDFRHGFEIGFANLLYSALLVIAVLVIERFTGFFTRVPAYLKDYLGPVGLAGGWVSYVTTPLVNAFTELLGGAGLIAFLAPAQVLVGAALFVLSMKNISRVVVDFLGGKRHARSLINKYMCNDFYAFLIGFALTMLVASNSASLSLVVPLAVAGVIKFRQAIPFAIGTVTGSFIDVLLGSIALGSSFAASAGLMFTLISLFGFAFLVSGRVSDFIHDSTRFLTRKVLRMNKGSAAVVLTLLILVPLLLLAT